MRIKPVQQGRFSGAEAYLFESPSRETALTSRLSKPTIKETTQAQPESTSRRIEGPDPRCWSGRRNEIVCDTKLVEKPKLRDATDHIGYSGYGCHFAQRLSPKKQASVCGKDTLK